jgi:formylglycine-generating enzyme required for sulfatase activity
MSEPVRVFVSYASPDRTFAERLVSDLQAAGAEVWWDVSGIDEGDFLGKINTALQQCQWLVLVLTPNAVASKWVNLEVNAAIHRREIGQMRGVLPMLASHVALDTIPPVWANLHRYDAVGNYQGAVARLTQTLGLPGAPAEPPRGQLGIPATSPDHTAPPDRFPPQLANLGYRVAFLNGAEVILPPMCDVPAGPFLMGCDPIKDKNAENREQPQHWVTLGGFQIAKFPVTVAEYACFVRGGYAEPKDALPVYTVGWNTQVTQRLDHPVVNIKWQDAIAYVTWLIQQTGLPWRLPTEAEWERAARWDAVAGYSRRYPWGDAFDASYGNTSEGKKGKTTPVWTYPNGASPYGALDMAGNVWEWTSSLYRPYPYNAIDGREHAESPGVRVMRGGCWAGNGKGARAACRGQSAAEFTNYVHGFRLARSVPSS